MARNIAQNSVANQEYREYNKNSMEHGGNVLVERD